MERGSDTNEIADMNVQKERVKEEHYAREMVIIRHINLSEKLRAKVQAKLSCYIDLETTERSSFLLFAGRAYYLSTHSTGVKIFRIVDMFVNDK
jgi:hypothetical protein